MSAAVANGTIHGCMTLNMLFFVINYQSKLAASPSSAVGLLLLEMLSPSCCFSEYMEYLQIAIVCLNYLVIAVIIL